MGKLYYGWLVVAGTFVSHLLSYGTLTVAFGIFFPFMAEALGASRGLLASAGVVTRLVSAGVAPLVGPLVDRRGPRPFVVLGVVSLALGALVLGLATSTWQVFLGYGVVMALASITLGDLTGDSTVTRWFVRRRGRALALATMGLSAAGIVVPLPLAALIDRVGWRASWLVVAGVVLVLGLAAALVMRRRPEDHGLLPDGDPVPATPAASARPSAPRERSLTAKQAARTPAFWLLVTSTNLAGLALFGVNLHLFSCMRDRGIAPATAAAIVTFLYVLHTAAKPLWGVVAERVHVRYCLASCYVGGALGVLLMMGATGAAGMVVASTVYGLTRGAQSFVTSLAWSDYFGRDAGGAIRGLASPFRFVASAAGPVVGGILFDATGGYGAAFAVFAALFALGGLVALAARPPADLPALTPSASTP